jgi:hypothetical protein
MEVYLRDKRIAQAIIKIAHQSILVEQQISYCILESITTLPDKQANNPEDLPCAS